MKTALVTFLIIGLSFLTFGQSASSLQFILNGNPIIDGDIVDVHSFKDLKIELSKEDEGMFNQLELQFVVIPFNMQVLVFKQKVSDLHKINIDEMLTYQSILPAQISHVQLNILLEEVVQSSITVFTRKLETPADYFQEFISHAEAGNAEMATWNLNQALQLDPENIEYLNARAQFYWETGDHETSLQLFDDLLNEKPNYMSHSYLGQIYMSQNNFSKASEHYLKSIEHTKNDAEVSESYTMLGTIELIQYHYETAYSNYKTALKYNTTNIGALNNIASVCDEVGKQDEKVSYFQRVIDADSSFYLIHVNIGFHYLGEEKFEKALSEFNQVLAIDSTEAATLNNKSFALLKLNRLDEALQFVNMSLSYGPLNSYAFRNRALIQLELGKNKLACEDLNQALELKFTEQYGNEVNELMEKNCP